MAQINASILPVETTSPGHHYADSILQPSRYIASITPNVPSRDQSRSFFVVSYLLVILLVALLDGRLCDTVQISLSALRDAATTLVLIALENTDLLQRLHDLPVDGSAGIDVVVGL
jgi:hypothetical protein